MAPKAIHRPVDLMLNVGTVLAGGALVVTSLVTTWGVWTHEVLGMSMAPYKQASEFGQADPTTTSVLVIGCAAVGILAAVLALFVDQRAAVLAGRRRPRCKRRTGLLLVYLAEREREAYGDR